MRFISLLMALVIVIFGVTFTILNSDSVTINYYVSQSTLPLSVLCLIIFVTGCLLGVIVNVWFMIRSLIIQRSLRHRVHSLETELQKLRSLQQEGVQ